MSFINNLIGAVQSYFAPKQSAPSPSSQSSQPIAGLQFSGTAPAGISLSSFSAPKSSGVNIQKAVSSGGLSKPSGGSSGGSSGGGSSGGNDNIAGTGASTTSLNPFQQLEKTVASTPAAHAIAPYIGKAAAGGERLASSFGQGAGLIANSLLDPIRNWAGSQSLMNANQGQPGAYNAISGQWADFNAPQNRRPGNLNPLDILMGIGQTRGNPNLNQYLQSPANQPSSAAGKLPTGTKGQTGVTPMSARGPISSPLTGANKNMVPSAVSSASLPANFQGLSSGNTNTGLTSQVTPQAMQSLGQMLLRSILGNQSSMNSMSPQLAQALWGAPTATSSFGGYDAGQAVPSLSSISPSKNVPPTPQPLAMG